MPIELGASGFFFNRDGTLNESLRNDPGPGLRFGDIYPDDDDGSNKLYDTDVWTAIPDSLYVLERDGDLDEYKLPIIPSFPFIINGSVHNI